MSWAFFIDALKRVLLAASGPLCNPACLPKAPGAVVTCCCGISGDDILQWQQCKFIDMC